MSNIKKFLPFVILIFFGFLIHYYYQKNQSDFDVLINFDFLLILQILFLCFLYLITEGIILRNIVIFLNKNINLLESFLVMNSTYFCNTFIQFSGLGYRVYYLKKFKNLKISDIIRFSIDTIACELLTFSFIGLLSILFIDLSSEKINISFILYLVFLFFFLVSLIYLYFIQSIALISKKILNSINFFYFDKIFDLFLILKKNNKFFYKKQILIFFFQYFLLFLIFYLILKRIEIENYLYLSLLSTSLVDFSFLIAFTPYSVGISEFITLLGTRDMMLTFAEIIILINVFRVCMLLIYFIFGPIFLIFNLKVKK